MHPTDHDQIEFIDQMQSQDQNDHWSTAPGLVPQVQPAALVIKMGFNRLLQYQPVTHYVFSLRCPTTQTWWIVRKRYSEYARIRKSLLRFYKLTHADIREHKITALLQSVVDFSFPRKYLRDDDDDIKAERLQGLRSFARLLMKIRLACMSLAVAQAIPTKLYLYYLNLIYGEISNFLHVPEPQVHQELHHVVGKMSPHVPVSSKNRSSTESITDDPCAICLDDYECDHEIVQLACGHSFHKNCVNDWLKEHCTCPLCRTITFDEEFMVEYVTQVVLAKSKDDLLFKINQARRLFDQFRHGSNVKAPRALLRESRHSINELGRNLACTVCMDILQQTSPETLELECGHAFHRSCIYQWLGDHTTCPICRRLSHFGHLPRPSAL